MDTIQALLPKTLEAKKLWAQQVCSLAKDNLVRGNKIATGQLLNSITYEIDLSTGDILFMYDEYGDFVEDGRRPGRMPPIEPIRMWAKVKGLQGRDKKGRFITDESLAWAIATSIKKNGIPAYPFYQMAIDEAIAQLVPELENATVLDLENIFDQEVANSGHMNF